MLNVDIKQTNECSHTSRIISHLFPILRFVYIEKQHLSFCVGCGGQIHDQYILRVSPDLEWHAACLKCQECRQFLDESSTCFVRDGKTYCKRDYVRLFGTKCDKCGSSFSKNDFVMRAKSKIYHIECFRCSACSRQLIPGTRHYWLCNHSTWCSILFLFYLHSIKVMNLPSEMAVHYIARRITTLLRNRSN